ncbi:glycosyltransferase [candidate division KSB1 bacterium]|nr:glycosyltransferase [candidate division KSB1 bacterium]
MKVLVIIPTFNERQNIPVLLNRIRDLKIQGLDTLIVDDNSPDGTGDLVQSLSRKDSSIHLIRRDKKMGLGTAYVTGFKYALERDYEYIIEMDADLSHDPEDIPRLLQAAQNYDLVIGSRYVDGVNVVHWPLGRLMLSMGASRYTRLITGLPLHDCTGGFKCFRRKVLESIDLDIIESDGYSFQIEMNFRAWKKGFKLHEISIVFTDRVAGTSKMSHKIIREAIWMVWKFKFLSLIGKI